MKKKLFNILLCISIICTMFVPIATNALPDNNMELTFAWNCNNGSICFSGLTVTKFNAESNYRTNYVNDYDIIDSGFAFSVADATSYGKENYKQQYYIFKGRYIDEIKTLYHGKWAELDEAFHDDPQGMPYPPIDPCGGVDGPHSVGHNGDREFRLVIHDRDYVPIKFDLDPTKYTYFLGRWEPIFANPLYDISNTTKEKPLVYNTYLLEDKVFFRMDGIKSVKALDVSNKGVNVQVVDGAVVSIKFNSNYFNEVTFEIELTNGKKHYLKVNRQFVRFADNNEVVMEAKENHEPAVDREAYAEFIFDEEDTYKNYDVYATYTVKGKTETVKLDAVKTKKRSFEGPFVEGMEVNAGIKLSSTRYKLNITKDTEDVYITVTKKGATEGDVYGGTFGGNGKGTKLDISNYLRALKDMGGRQ